MKKKNYHIAEDDSDVFYGSLVQKLNMLNSILKGECYNEKTEIVEQSLKNIIQNEIDDNEEEKEI